MNKKKEVKKDNDKKQIADDYSKKITYSTIERPKGIVMLSGWSISTTPTPSYRSATASIPAKRHNLESGQQGF